jgi:hypothetical protein
LGKGSASRPRAVDLKLTVPLGSPADFFEAALAFKIDRVL